MRNKGIGNDYRYLPTWVTINIFDHEQVDIFQHVLAAPRGPSVHPSKEQKLNQRINQLEKTVAELQYKVTIALYEGPLGEGLLAIAEHFGFAGTGGLIIHALLIVIHLPGLVKC